MENLVQYFKPIGQLLSSKPLKDRDLLPADQSSPIETPYVSVSISLFNDAADQDADQLLAVTDAPIRYDPAADAYLKYSTVIKAGIDKVADLTQLPLAASLSAQVSARQLYYAKHANTGLIRDAIAKDISGFPAIFSFSDLAALQPGEALAWLVDGSLTCNVQVSWSNILTQSLSVLSGILPMPLTLDVQLTPALTASFDVSVTDSFMYFAARQADGRLLISVNKTKRKTLSAQAGASIGVAFSNPDEVKGQLDAIYAAIESSVAGRAAEQIDTIKAALDLVRDKINGVLGQAARANISFSFGCQYQRMEEGKELLSVMLADSALKPFHSDLLLFRTGPLLAAMRAAAMAYELRSYLDERSLTIKKTWGFGLKIFDRTLILGQDHFDKKEATTTDINGKQQKTIDYQAGYKWQWGKRSGSWMGEWVGTPDSKSILLNFVLQDPHMEESDLRAYLDMAVLWGAVRQEDVAGIIQKYSALFGSAVLFETRLSIGMDVMNGITEQILHHSWDGINRQYLARGLAAAMSYLPEYALRSDPQTRENTYQSLWLGYLNAHDTDQRPEDYAAAAADTIEAWSDKDHLAAFENNPANWTFGDSFAGAIRTNPDLLDIFKDFCTDLSHITSMTGVFKYSLSVKALGYFLLLHAADAALTEDIQRTATITTGSGDNEKVINFAVVQR